ncbi:hypothetical protein GQ457_03G005510 [Hibiscus cannabinus]
MANIIETCEANTRMMKQNSEMLQKILRQLKSLSVHLGIVDEGEISDVGKVEAKQNDPTTIVTQVFEKLPTPIAFEIKNHTIQGGGELEFSKGVTYVEGISEGIEGALSLDEPSNIPAGSKVQTPGVASQMKPSSSEQKLNQMVFDELQLEERTSFLVNAHKPRVELQEYSEMVEVLKFATVGGHGALRTNFVNDPSKFRLLLMERTAKWHEMNLQVEINKIRISTTNNVTVNDEKRRMAKGEELLKKRVAEEVRIKILRAQIGELKRSTVASKMELHASSRLHRVVHVSMLNSSLVGCQHVNSRPLWEKLGSISSWNLEDKVPLPEEGIVVTHEKRKVGEHPKLVMLGGYSNCY